jgi:glycosyltransferase involved in cell wall biosynthesis
LKREVEISAVVPVSYKFEPSGSLASEYLSALNSINRNFELIYVIDERETDQKRQLMEIAKKDGRVRILQMARNFGTAAFLSAGFEKSNGEIILTLPAYYKILAIGVRSLSRPLSGLAKMRREVFNWVTQKVAGYRFRDLSCGLRALRRQVADEVPLYGAQDTFFPLLAAEKGFRVSEVEVEESDKSPQNDSHGPGMYLRRAVDVLTLLFIVRFTKKPLRFFGVVGVLVLVVGIVLLSFVIYQRLFMGISLADRPALLLGSLLVVLGLQILAIGLLGELIIFSHADDVKEYHVEEIIN